jgi:hypothetical protein
MPKDLKSLMIKGDTCRDENDRAIDWFESDLGPRVGHGEEFLLDSCICREGCFDSGNRYLVLELHDVNVMIAKLQGAYPIGMTDPRDVSLPIVDSGDDDVYLADTKDISDQSGVVPDQKNPPSDEAKYAISFMVEPVTGAILTKQGSWTRYTLNQQPESDAHESLREFIRRKRAENGYQTNEEFKEQQVDTTPETTDDD